MSDLRNARTNAEVYFADHNKYPDSFVVENKIEGSTRYQLVPDEGMPKTEGNISPYVALEYRKLSPGKFQITASHEKGNREYRYTSDDSAIYWRDKKDPAAKWQAL